MRALAKPPSIRSLTPQDIPAMWRINEQGLPGVGRVARRELTDLLHLCAHAWGAFEEQGLIGFVLCLRPGMPYGSPNYAWFNEHYDDFLYVDRIAIAQGQRNSGVGSCLYARVFKQAQKDAVPVAAEVNLEPPNPGSMRFHARHHFNQVGTLNHPSYRVAMVMRPAPKTDAVRKTPN